MKWRYPPTLLLGMGLAFFFVLLALLTPLLPLEAPGTLHLEQEYQGPTAQHCLGQGENGVDLLSQVAWGSRLALLVAFGSVLLSAVIGTVLGAWAGYRGGRYEFLLMRLVDLVHAFPGILLVVALAVVLGPSVRNVIIVLIASSWAGYARLARGIVLGLREREFVRAAEALGAGTLRLVTRHLLPNLLAPLLVRMSFALGASILTESSLSFLGLGAPPGTVSWGHLLNQGRQVLTLAPHVVMVPGAALVLCVLALNLVGDALRDYLDPRRSQRGTFGCVNKA